MQPESNSKKQRKMGKKHLTIDLSCSDEEFLEALREVELFLSQAIEDLESLPEPLYAKLYAQLQREAED